MGVWRRMWPLIRPHLGLVTLNLGQVALVAGLQLVAPWAVGWIIDRVLTGGQWQYLWPGAAAILLAAIAQGGLRFSQRYGAEVVAQRIIYALRDRLYRHLHALSFAFFDQTRTGELMSRLTSDVETLRLALGMGVVNMIQHVTTVAFLSAVMLFYNWHLGLMALVFLLPVTHAVVMFGRVVRPTFAEVQEKTADLTAAVQENVAGVRVVRAFAREPEEIERFAVQNRALQAVNVRSVRMGSFYGNYMQFLTSVGLVAVLWYGGRLVAAGRLTPGELVSFNLYLMQLVQPVRMLGWLVNVFNRAAAGAGRIFEFLDTQPEVAEAPDARILPPVRGEVRLEGVGFSYDGGTPVLADIDLTVRPGERVAILGLTGSGKSSLVSLIPRFYDTTAGRVCIDGHDVRDVTLDSLRRQIGLVFQETFLFSTTLRENIAYGRPQATMAEIEAAARAAQIHDFIATLPDGYDSVVGERGVGLSGGQRQRIAIARALLVNTPIVILDESTASVDVETERRIHAAMDRVMEGRTALVIAQRVTTVRGADQVVVLDGGRIAECGTHAELLARGGLYRRIYDLQLAGSATGEVAVG